MQNHVDCGFSDYTCGIIFDTFPTQIYNEIKNMNSIIVYYIISVFVVDFKNI